MKQKIGTDALKPNQAFEILVKDIEKKINILQRKVSKLSTLYWVLQQDLTELSKTEVWQKQ